MIRCTNCKNPYPQNAIPYCCPKCGGIFDYDDLGLSNNVSASEEAVDLPGIWKYRHKFQISDSIMPISIGEGNTPLIWSDVLGKEIGFKLEYTNPTGSFKDRGTALLVSFLKSRGVRSAIEDSSGNAGASFSAYAARAGIGARVFVPDQASPIKLNQIAAYHAGVVRVPGPRSSASSAVKLAADQGVTYASHAYLPHGIPGFSTIAYELFDKLGDFGGTIVVPCGQGSLVLGIIRGFYSLQEDGLINRIPRVVAVQARKCAPVWAVFHFGSDGQSWVTEGDTKAEGVRIRYPLRGDQILSSLRLVDGDVIAVDEEDIDVGRFELARLGFLVESTSAIVWRATSQIIDNTPEPIIVILTGSGLKNG